MLIDSHAHLEMEAFDQDRQAVIDRARENGVDAVITVGTNPGEWSKVRQLVEQDIVFGAIGVSPHDWNNWNAATIDKMEPYFQHPKIVALGEAGLDYHYDYPRDKQKECFVGQLDLAKKHNLPVIIHSRQAHSDVIAILKEEKIHRGVMHCFSGDETILKECLDLGFHISIAGPVTFSNAKKLQKLVNEIPFNRLLIETDSPYLTPMPYRGKRNEPVYIKYIAEKIAQLSGHTIEDVARTTAHNTRDLFGLPGKVAQGEIAYVIRNSLYLNITNRCSNSCTFCARNTSFFVKGHNLKIDCEPTEQEILKAITDPSKYKEVVFCGFGEPLLRLDLVKNVARRLKEKNVPVRINTNGHGNLIYGRDITPELDGLVDEISISLNTGTSQQYHSLCRPQFEGDVFSEVKKFIRCCKTHIPQVSLTAVDLPEVDLEKCRTVAQQLGVRFRFRRYNIVG
jgi:TatD DNase family protein